MKHIKNLIIPLVIVIIIFISLLLFQLLRKETTIISVKNNLIFNYEDEVYLLDTLSVVDGIILSDNYKLDTSTLGNKEIEIKYKNNKGWTKKYKYNYNVIDNISPILSVSSNLYLEVGDDINTTLKNVFCGDNYDRQVSLSITGDYDVNTVGNYNVQVHAIDNSNNENIKNSKLHVYQKTNSSNNNNNTSNKLNGIELKYFLENYKRNNTSIGIDISTFQNVEDFNKVKNAGIDFVFIRLGWGPNQDLTFNIDNKFEDFYQRAKEAGLKVGIYYFSYATTLDEVDLEVEFVKENLKDKDIDLYVSYDWENWSLFKDCNMNFHDLNKMASKFITKLQESGYRAMNYSSAYYLDKIWNIDEYDNWLAQYNDEATTKKKFKIWQITDKGIVDGINNLVDIDIMYLD